MGGNAAVAAVAAAAMGVVLKLYGLRAGSLPDWPPACPPRRRPPPRPPALRAPPPPPPHPRRPGRGGGGRESEKAPVRCGSTDCSADSTTSLSLAAGPPMHLCHAHRPSCLLRRCPPFPPPKNLAAWPQWPPPQPLTSSGMFSSSDPSASGLPTTRSMISRSASTPACACVCVEGGGVRLARASATAAQPGQGSSRSRLWVGAWF